jgi:Fe-S cluster assembly protein SufB
MPTETSEIETLANREYQWGFVTDIEADSAPMGLNEDIVRFISHKKGEPLWLLDWRLKAYRHWLTMAEPQWPMVHYPPIDSQKTI